MAAKPDSIQFFHDQDLFLPRRSILISGEVDKDLFDRTFKNLHILDGSPGKITIFLNSEGGDFTYCQAIYDAIKGCKNDVEIMVYGEASSAASIFLQAADRRIMSPSSYLMIHIGQESYDGHAENKKRWDAKHEQDYQWMVNIYLSQIKQKKPKFSKSKLDEMLRFDTILTPKQALDLNLIDEIVESY